MKNRRFVRIHDFVTRPFRGLRTSGVGLILVGLPAALWFPPAGGAADGVEPGHRAGQVQSQPDTKVEALAEYRAGQFEAARERFLKGAEAGDAECARLLGIMALKGQGTPQDSREAYKWFTRAAETNPVALYNLGELYWGADGVERNLPRASDLFRRSAEQGFPPAQFRVGEIWLKIADSPEERSSALPWFQKAAAAGVGMAKLRLAQAYAAGGSVPEDRTESFRLMEEAAAAGVTKAQSDLGVRLINGIGVPRDLERGVQLLKQAAGSDALAQYNLARVLLSGVGVPKDEAEAYKLLLLASAGGHAEAGVTRAELDLSLPFEQIVNGIERARSHREKYPRSEYSSDPQLCRDLEYLD